MDELYELQRLLWDMRHDAQTSVHFQTAPDEVMDRYGLSDPDRFAMKTGDFGSLIQRGANPLLVLFGAIKTGVSRREYYRRVQANSNPSAGRGH